MPVSPIDGRDYGEAVGRILRDAELRVLALVAKTLNHDPDSPVWQRAVLVNLQALRPRILATMTGAARAAADEALKALTAAYATGYGAAFVDAGQGAVSAPAQAAAVQAIAESVVSNLAEIPARVLRGVDDGVRQIVGSVVAQDVLGATYRRQSIQNALDDLVAGGFRVIPVGRGSMSAGDYADMAVRTGSAQALVEGHVRALGDLSVELVVVIPGPRACPICDQWARKVLARTGSTTGTLEVEGFGDRDTQRVKVDGTLDQAKAAGWGHPNCRCGLGAFLPGVTPRPKRPKWDREGYAAQQRQRVMERKIREWKEREAVAVMPSARAQAKAKVAEWQAAQRAHLRENPALKRRSDREQVRRPSST